MMPHKKRTRFRDLFQGSGLTFIVVFVMEMIEEGLENLIALGVSALFSTVLLVCITQLAKIGIKKLIKFILPFAKSLFYKEGNDKMEKLKKFWSWLVANKCTLLGIGTGAVVAVSGAGVIDVNSFPALVVGAVNITPILYYLVLGVLTIVASFFPETIEKFKARIVEKKAEKEAKAILKAETKEKRVVEKEAEKRLAEQEKQATLSQAEKEKSDAEAKAKEAFEKKVKEAMAKKQEERANAQLNNQAK